MADDSGGSGGLGRLALAVPVVGGLYLFQRDGGQVFDTNKFEPAPPAVQGVEATFDTGFRTHDVVLTHKHNEGVLPKYTGLMDVDLTVTLYRRTASPGRCGSSRPRGRAGRLGGSTCRRTSTRKSS